MKSMKKMLCLLLVAMLLVAAIPVAAGANGDIAAYNAPEAEPDVPKDVGKTEVNYSVLFVVKNTDTNELGYSTTIAVCSVASDANEDTVRAAAAGAVATAGYSTVTADAIVSRVSANGYADVVHGVRYGAIRTKIDTANKQFKYILEVTTRPTSSTTDVVVDAKILLDKENTGNYEYAGTVPVTLVKTTYGETETYSMKTNGGATVDDIKGVLGANYKNKTLSMTVQGPSADGEVTYRVVVKGSGSTGTNIPTYDGTGSNNNGGNNIGNGSTGTNIPGYNPGNGSSNNGGVGNSGYDFGINGRTVNFMCDGKVVYSKLVKNDAELEVAKAEAVKAIQALGCYKFKGWK